MPSLENIGKHIKYKGERVDVAFEFSNTIKKRLTQNSNKDKSSGKGLYIPPCLDCNNRNVGETGRGLSGWRNPRGMCSGYEKYCCC